MYISKINEHLLCIVQYPLLFNYTYYCVMLVVYDLFQNSGEYLTFAAISKIFAASITYPYQVVRARLQDQHRSYKGVMDVVLQTWR